MRFVKIFLLLVCLIGFPVVAFWLGDRIRHARDVAKDCVSECRFAQIEYALLAYHEQYKAFPPTKCRSTPEGPAHSWRVLLVPFTDVEYRERYSDYDFSQEWNSPNNRRALGHMPLFYYFNMGENSEVAHYLGIGEQDEWPSRTPLKSLLVTKGNDRFLVVEYPDSRVPWMEPTY